VKVEIVEQPVIRGAALRHVGSYQRIGETFGRLGAIAAGDGSLAKGARMFAAYHDDPRTTPEAQLRSDAAVEIGSAGKVPAGLTEVSLPAGRYAVTRYVGPYDGLPAVWMQLMGEWFPTSGQRRRDGVSYELYLNDPSRAAKEELITEIYVPVA
jgi:AraC family transcriptional regulator